MEGIALTLFYIGFGLVLVACILGTYSDIMKGPKE